jgi:hypothetical protein
MPIETALTLALLGVILPLTESTSIRELSDALYVYGAFPPDTLTKLSCPSCEYVAENPCEQLVSTNPKTISSLYRIVDYCVCVLSNVK